MRNLKMDNIKGMLILLVVTGHTLELFMGRGPGRTLYILIYLFHMPLFVYCSGYFARRKNMGKRLLYKMLLPYIAFQTLYLLFAKFLLGEAVEIGYFTPYWLMWYLFAMVVWTLLLPLVATDSLRRQVFFLTVSVGLALGAGFMRGIGRYLSLSRIIVFLPFFLLGFYGSSRGGLEGKGGRSWRSVVLLLFTTLVVGYAFLHGDEWQVSWLYEASPYGKSGYDIGFRGYHMVAALLGILCAVGFMPEKKLPFLTGLGAKTMPIYLCHGFVMKWIGKEKLFDQMKWKGLAAFLLIAAIMVVFSWFPTALRVLFGGSGLCRPDRES